jgi:N-acetylmuramoyl-L-alanine amidase
MATIVLDPGHGGTKPIGGSDPNHARGPSGLLEKTITIDIAKRVKTRLVGGGHTVVLTRSTDVNLSLADRAGVAKKRKAPVFVSIHFNGFDHTTQGTETFCHLRIRQYPRTSAGVYRRVL